MENDPESSQCTNKIQEIIKPPNAKGDLNYRYFNQPIEQIPGYNPILPQILAHRPNCGLQWISIDMCLPVVTCLELQSDKLKVKRRSIVVIKDFKIEDDTDCDIEITDCEDEE
jgi:hypothetical protein